MQLGSARYRGAWLPVKQREEIRNHLLVCARCQTELVASRKKQRLCIRLQAAASDWVKRSTVLRLRVMQFAGIVATLASITWLLTDGPRRLVGPAETILPPTVGRARDTAAPHRPTQIDAVSSGIGTSLQPVEAPSPSTHHSTGDRSVRGQITKPPKKRTPYHLKSDRLYTMEQAKSLIQRFRTLGYTARATPVQSDDETMYRIEVGTFKTEREADDAADDLESRYNSAFKSP
jgi:hypothetical protein